MNGNRYLEFETWLNGGFLQKGQIDIFGVSLVPAGLSFLLVFLQFEQVAIY
jgi:hypothetical protein